MKSERHKWGGGGRVGLWPWTELWFLLSEMDSMKDFKQRRIIILQHQESRSLATVWRIQCSGTEKKGGRLVRRLMR